MIRKSNIIRNQNRPVYLLVVISFLFQTTASLTPSGSSKRILSQQSPPNRVSLSEYLRNQEDGRIDKDLVDVLQAAADACCEISKKLRQLPLLALDGGDVNVQGEQQKGMDVLANEIFKEHVGPTVAAMASEEEKDVLIGSAAKTCTYEIAFDPLDGSSNLDVNIPTGTIFGISKSFKDKTPFSSSGRSSLMAAGYAVYSSSTEFALSFGDKAIGFALDSSDEFQLSRPCIVCPPNGPYYSLNEAREPDWPKGLRQWIYDAKRGKTPSGITYSSRYVCSLCADVHRSLLKGGWAGNPRLRPHLRLLYEAAPMAFILEAAGGRGSDGTQELLDIEPKGLHDRVCVFLGSKVDIEELESYGDIQQVGKRYEA